MERRSAAIRKCDLVPVFQAAKAAGYDQVSVIVETTDGKRLQITAGGVTDANVQDISPLEKWQAQRAAI